MMTTMPGILGKKKPLDKPLKEPKMPDFASKKPMMKINKQAPMLGRNFKNRKV